MTFIYVPLSDQTFKEINLRKPTASYLAGKPSHWVVDHENNIQFLSLGGRGSMPESQDQPPSFFLLLWREYIIQLESRYTTLIEDNQRTIVHEFFGIYMPMILKTDEMAIKEAIAGAIKTHWIGLASDRYLVKSVTINFAPINFF